jgi:hypothetical protein
MSPEASSRFLPLNCFSNDPYLSGTFLQFAQVDPMEPEVRGLHGWIPTESSSMQTRQIQESPPWVAIACTEMRLLLGLFGPPVYRTIIKILLARNT